MARFVKVKPEGNTERNTSSDFEERQEKKKSKIKWVWFVLIVFLIILWFGALTSILPEPEFTDTQINQATEKNFPGQPYSTLSEQNKATVLTQLNEGVISLKEWFYYFAIAGTIIFFLYWIFALLISNREREARAKEKSVIVIASHHDFESQIKQIGRQQGLTIGYFWKYLSDPAGDEQSGAAPVKYALYQILEFGRVIGLSCWKISLIKKPIVELQDRVYFKRDSHYRYWTGQAKTQPPRPLASGAAVHKRKSKTLNIETQEERDEPSLTE